MVVNYGSNQVRFLTPVRVGSRIRALQKILEVSEKSKSTWLMKTAITVEIEHGNKPALKAELLTLYILER
jgi:acyl dehydratase